MKGLIISGGNVSDYKLLEELSINVDFILCADGGIRHAIAIKRNPDAVIGDLDSTRDEDLEYISKNSIPVIKYPVEKDETDTELAINYLIRRGYRDITLTGVTGSRMDHSLANIFLLDRLMTNGISGRIVDGHNTIYMADKGLSLFRKEGHYVSILPINSDGVTVSLKGFYYPLENEKIEFGSTLGISNKIIDCIGIVEIISGIALVIESID